MTKDMMISSTGLTTRIHRLEGREPFMLAADLAEVYGTTTKRIGEQVKRNPKRFPPHHAFRLSEAEMEHLRSQNATTTMDRALPLAFTRAGATGLSAVLKTSMADEVHVIVHDAFAAMERRAFEQMRALVAGIRIDAATMKPIYAKIRMAAMEGLSFDTLWRKTSYSQAKLELAVREMVELGLLDAPLAGMQPDLFAKG